MNFIHEVFTHNPGIPFIFHFKEGPFICLEKGTWPLLTRVLLESDGNIFINDESYEWFQLALHGLLDPAKSLVIDGDLPSATWFTEDWSPKLSAQDGEIHTVCAGRPIGMNPRDLADAGIHTHFYGVQFHQMSPNFSREGVETGYMHLHDSVQPADWVRELSKYDAGWFHIHYSRNGGDLRRANWDDLNMPARLGTYAAAGLPWILADNRASRTGVGSAAATHDVGIFYSNPRDLREQLLDRARVAQLTSNMRAARHQFAFDTHVDRLIAFFREAIARKER
jgi:hypothetical protein